MADRGSCIRRNDGKREPQHNAIALGHTETPRVTEKLCVSPRPLCLGVTPGNRALTNSGLANGHSALYVILSGAKNPESFGARVVRYPEKVHPEGF